MKLKKIIAAVAAAAFAVSAMAVNTFALSGKNYVKDNGSGVNAIYIQADKATDPSWANDSGVAITDVYGAKFYITGKGDWYGGKVCLNSNSTSWKEIDEWDNGSKPIVEVDGVVTYLSDKPLFADSDGYAQICLLVYPGSDVTINNVEILGKGGVVLSTDDTAPAEDKAADEKAEDKADDKAADTADDKAADTTDDKAADTAEDTEEDTAVDTEEDADDDADADEAEDTDADEAEDTADNTAADTSADTAADTGAEKPASDSSSNAAKTGNVPAAAMVSVMALAGAAAVVSKKRK